MRLLLVIYGLLAYTNIALAAPNSIPSAEGWSDFHTLGKEAAGLDSIDKTQIENHPLNQAFPPPQNSDIRPVELLGEGGGNTSLDTPLNTIIPANLNLKAKTDRVKELKTRKVYDYREKPPAPFFQKEQYNKSNIHLPGVFYQADFTRLLFSAVDQGNLGAVSSLLGSGADINGRLKESGTTPLILAVKNGFGNLTQYLVIRGAKVNIADNAGRTALHVAATKQDYAIITFLLDNGAAIDAVDNTGKKPLDYLPEDKRVSIIVSRINTQAEFDKALIDFTASNSYLGASLAINKGANVNACDSNGDTPLLIAARAHSSDIIALLLSHGANPLKVDRSGKSAMDYAVEQNDLRLAQLIDTYAIRYELEHGISRPKAPNYTHYLKPQPNKQASIIEKCNEDHEAKSGLIEEKPLPKLESDVAPTNNLPKSILPQGLKD